MKKFVSSTVITGFALAIGLSTAPVETFAAAAAPVFSVVNGKAIDGFADAHGAPTVVADGINFYMVASATSGRNVLQLVRSKDGGVTWGGAHTVYTLPADGSSFGRVSVAVSGDPASTTQKIVHVAFEVNNQIYYTWADSTNIDSSNNGWSTPVLLNGSVPSVEDPCLAVSKAGQIFVKFMANSDTDKAMYLTTAAAHDLTFTAPTVIPVSNNFPNDGQDAEIYLDSANNLHMSYPYCDSVDCLKEGIKYTMYSAATNTWSVPTTVLPLTPRAATPTYNVTGHSGLVAYDASNIFITSVVGGDLRFFRSINGGNTWTTKVIAAKNTIATPQTIYTDWVDVTVNASKAITVAAKSASIVNGSSTKSDGKVFRSTDLGLSWSTAATIPTTAEYISLAVDGNGKTGVVTRTSDLDGGNPVSYFTKEK